MAHTHNSNHHQATLLESIGNKVKTGAQIAGTIKGIWDLGRTIYTGVRTIAPIVASVAAVL